MTERSTGADSAVDPVVGAPHSPDTRDENCSTCHDLRLLLADHVQAVQTLAADLRAIQYGTDDEGRGTMIDIADVQIIRAVADRLDGLAAARRP